MVLGLQAKRIDKAESGGVTDCKTKSIRSDDTNLVIMIDWNLSYDRFEIWIPNQSTLSKHLIRLISC